MDVNRRNFLRGAAVGAAGTAITGAALVKGAEVDANAAAVAVPPSRYPFHGVHQSGILVPPRPKSRTSPVTWPSM